MTKYYKILILSLLLFAGHNTSYAQEYTPLVREGVVWQFTEVIDTDDGVLKQAFNLELIGDTVINNKTYKKCYRYRAGHKGEMTIAGMLREQDKQVFAVKVRESSETVIYDFNDWETISQPYAGNAPELRSVYEVLIGSTTRMMYLFDDDTFIIEGIGIDSTVYGLLNPFSTESARYALVSVSEGETVVYQGKNYDMSNIPSIPSDCNITDVLYYNMQGMSSRTPWNGINVVVTFYDNGMKTTEKKIINIR